MVEPEVNKMEIELNKFKNLLFLDVDGVYNSDLFYKEKFGDIIFKSNKKPIHRIITKFLRKKFKANEISKYEYYEQNMCPRVMSLINTLCEETNTCVVISASMRNGHDLEEIRDIFKHCGATFTIIDKTPYTGYERGTEISKWLKDNCMKWFGVHYFDFHSFCIVDDVSDFLINQQFNFFKVDSYCGFTPTNYNDIRKFLTHKTF
jgi:hypothetical protein